MKLDFTRGGKKRRYINQLLLLEQPETNVSGPWLVDEHTAPMVLPKCCECYTQEGKHIPTQWRARIQIGKRGKSAPKLKISRELIIQKQKRQDITPGGRLQKTANHKVEKVFYSSTTGRTEKKVSKRRRRPVQRNARRPQVNQQSALPQFRYCI